MKKLISSAFILIVLVTEVSANIRLPKIFADNMVLQRDQAITIWGWAAPGEKITIQLINQTKTLKTGKDGIWKTLLQAEQAGGPYQLIITGNNIIKLNNILIGDVWICSGQSNMEWMLRNTNDAMKEIQESNYPMIRNLQPGNFRRFYCCRLFFSSGII